MTFSSNHVDAVIIGGGFYGSTIAIYMARQRGFKRIILIEKEPGLLSRASYHNQARVHNGYHYPRSFTTAYRSRVNLPKFVLDWPNAVKRDFISLYAIAKRSSKVTARQFERFCQEIGAKIQPAEPGHKKLFEPRLIEAVFEVEEYAFDAGQLSLWAETELRESGVEIRLGARVAEVVRSQNDRLLVSTVSEEKSRELIHCRYVFNCTYSGINQIAGQFAGTRTGLKQEITEMALVQVPTPLERLGVTVMDGPFFSIMPFPARGLHTLSHVRYTPHFSWQDEMGRDPYKLLESYGCGSRVDRMIRDVGRYMPTVLEAEYVESLFEVKTVLLKNEGDDGRPILFEKSSQLPGFYSILGGKIDNIYDVLEMLEHEQFEGFKEK